MILTAGVLWVLTGDQTGQDSRSAGHRAETSLTVMDIRSPDLQGVTMTGSTTQGIKTVLHPVSDLEAAKAVYTALLGVAPTARRRGRRRRSGPSSITIAPCCVS